MKWVGLPLSVSLRVGRMNAPIQVLNPIRWRASPPTARIIDKPTLNPQKERKEERKEEAAGLEGDLGSFCNVLGRRERSWRKRSWRVSRWR